MSVISYLTSGGMAMIDSDLPKEEQETINDALRLFSDKVSTHAIALQVPAAKLRVRQATFLFVGKNLATYYVVLVAGTGGNRIIYRDLSSQGVVDRDAILGQLQLEVGEPLCAFSIPIGLPDLQLQQYLDDIARRYVGSILQIDRDETERMGAQAALLLPEITSGLARFRLDHAGKKTAFIMMQFRSSQAHTEIVDVVKTTLAHHSIVGLRADDKQYLDDLFPNVRVYMHACDFGIAVFERIEADDFNPNVSLEVGYMFGLGKDILLLKDRTLTALPTDLTGRLYRQFDTRDPTTSAPPEIRKWLNDKGIA